MNDQAVPARRMTLADALHAVGGEVFEPMLTRLIEAGAIASIRDHRGVVLWTGGESTAPAPTVGTRVTAGTRYVTPDGREFPPSDRPADRARLSGRPSGPVVYSAELPGAERNWFIVTSIPVSSVGGMWAVVSVGYHLDGDTGFSRFRDMVADSPKPFGGIVEGPGGLHLNPNMREACVGHEPLDLSPLEFDLLEFLLRRRGEAVSTDEISLAVWGHGTFGERNYIEAAISRLRRKLARAGARDVIAAVRGHGYRVR